MSLLQNEGEIVGWTADRQLYVLTMNDDWLVSVHRGVYIEREEQLQAVTEQGVGLRWRLSEYEPSVDQWQSEVEELLVSAARMLRIWKTSKSSGGTQVLGARTCHQDGRDQIVGGAFSFAEIR